MAGSCIGEMDFYHQCGNCKLLGREEEIREHVKNCPTESESINDSLTFDSWADPDEPLSGNVSEGETSELLQGKNVFAWSNSATLLLLSIYKEKLERFKFNKKKTIWTEIATAMAKHGYQLSHIQCDNKIKGLLSSYRKVKDNNRLSSSKRITCKFYEELDAMFCKAPTINPVSASSSLSGFKVRSNSERRAESSARSPSSPFLPSPSFYGSGRAK
ncbi:zinc finger and SCAN domain-containing protein 29 [Parasteatoda tepidariorum]|uniref:zinc finger and SCAN domain-containing protein 29 n=1 Tax=Parasteatoda tepidariorum TaxID=114398 RepID=UPI0039BC378E